MRCEECDVLRYVAHKATCYAAFERLLTRKELFDEFQIKCSAKGCRGKVTIKPDIHHCDTIFEFRQE